MASGKLLCKSHLGSFFLACKYAFLYSVFPKYFPPKEWALLCSVWAQEWPWVLGMQRGPPRGAYFLSEPQSKRALVYRAALWLLCWLVSRYCWSPTAQRAGDPASDPTNAWATSWEVGMGRDQDMRNFARTVPSSGCRVWDRGRRRSCPLWCPLCAHRAAERSSNVGVSSVRAASIHWALLITTAGWLLPPLHSWGSWSTKRRDEEFQAKVWTQHTPSHISLGLGVKGSTQTWKSSTLGHGAQPGDSCCPQEMGSVGRRSRTYGGTGILFPSSVENTTAALKVVVTLFPR